MLRKEIFIAKNIDEVMDLAVEHFGISSEKIFINVLEQNDFEVKAEALIDINLLLEGRRYLESILNQFNIEYRIEAKADFEETQLYYSVLSNDNSILIGFKGRTLDALQHLVRDLLRTLKGENVIVTLDIGGYREKRKRQIEIVATKIAKEVAKTKVDVMLDCMNSFERRIVHAKLSDWRDVTTESTGQGDKRRVVIKAVKN